MTDQVSGLGRNFKSGQNSITGAAVALSARRLEHTGWHAREPDDWSKSHQSHAILIEFGSDADALIEHFPSHFGENRHKGARVASC